MPTGYAFERKVEKLPTDCDSGLWKADVIKLLRAQHRATVRMVKKERREIEELAAKTMQSQDPRDQHIAECLRSRAVQCTDILTQLNARAK
jgi:hypothetical protein